MYSEEAKLLGKNQIHTVGELSLFTEKLSEEFKVLACERAKYRNRLRRMRDSEAMQPVKDEISRLSLRMADLRRRMKLCEDIAERSGVIEQIVNAIEMPDKQMQTSRKHIKEKPEEEKKR